MAFENLSDKLAGVFKKLRSKGKLSEADVKSAMREVRLARMEWHDILAWVVIVAAAATAVVWLIRRLICPTTHCEGCNKNCILKHKNKY